MRAVELIGGWWHADDIETALEELRVHLDEHGLGDALPEARLRSDHVSAMEHDLEELQREHQIGVTAVAANELLAQRGDARRFRAFNRALASESNEPAWLLVTPEEHAKLRAESGALDPLDAIYDGARSVAELPAIVWPVPELSPAQAGDRAYKAFWEQRYLDALQWFPLAVTSVQNGYVAEIAWIESLVRVGDLVAAAERWRITADRWHRDRFAWDRQWEQLEALYTAVGLDDAARLARVVSKKPAPSKPREPVELGTGVFDEAILLNVGALWMVKTSVRVLRDDRLIVGHQDIVIPEDVTYDRDRLGIRILDERAAPAKATPVRFVRG